MARRVNVYVAWHVFRATSLQHFPGLLHCGLRLPIKPIRTFELAKMNSQKKVLARKATWLAFGLIALAAVSSAAREHTPNKPVSEASVTDLSVNKYLNHRFILVIILFGFAGVVIRVLDREACLGCV